jgi:uncharacterized FlgJ-related protein
MLYTFDKKRIRFNKINTFVLFLYTLIIISIVSGIGWLTGYKSGFDYNIETLSDEEKYLVIESIDPFSEEKLVNMMKELNIQYPHIVMAQSILETGQWKSDIFLSNHNLFGMKRASRRVSTAKGTNLGHAYYDTWRESVYDYAFYQCRYLGKLKSEAEYFSYLKANYAGDTTYIQKLTNIINTYNVRDKFK